MKKILSLVFAVSLLLAPMTIFAEELAKDLPNTSEASIYTVIDTVGNIIFGVLLLIALIYILFAAISFITAQGDAAKLKTAQDRILYALIGIGVAVLSKGLIALVLRLTNV